MRYTPRMSAPNTTLGFNTRRTERHLGLIRLTAASRRERRVTERCVCTTIRPDRDRSSAGTPVRMAETVQHDLPTTVSGEADATISSSGTAGVGQPFSRVALRVPSCPRPLQSFLAASKERDDRRVVSMNGQEPAVLMDAPVRSMSIHQMQPGAALGDHVGRPVPPPRRLHRHLRLTAAGGDDLSGQVRRGVVDPTPRHPIPVLVQHDHHRPAPVQIDPLRTIPYEPPRSKGWC